MIAVIGATYKRAVAYMNVEILNKIPPVEITKMVTPASSGGYRLHLKDGKVYRAFSIDLPDKLRGIEIEKALVDYQITIEQLENIVLPCLQETKINSDEALVFWE